jgi:hypothetical protein
LPPPRKSPEGRPAPKLGPYRPLIDEWLKADREAPSNQRHTAKRIWQHLVAAPGPLQAAAPNITHRGYRVARRIAICACIALVRCAPSARRSRARVHCPLLAVSPGVRCGAGRRRRREREGGLAQQSTLAAGAYCVCADEGRMGVGAAVVGERVGSRVLSSQSRSGSCSPDGSTSALLRFLPGQAQTTPDDPPPANPEGSAATANLARDRTQGSSEPPHTSGREDARSIVLTPPDDKPRLTTGFVRQPLTRGFFCSSGSSLLGLRGRLLAQTVSALTCPANVERSLAGPRAPSAAHIALDFH